MSPIEPQTKYRRRQCLHIVGQKYLPKFGCYKKKYRVYITIILVYHVLTFSRYSNVVFCSTYFKNDIT